MCCQQWLVAECCKHGLTAVSKAVMNDNVSSHNITNLCALILKQPLMSTMDQIYPPWQKANISVLFNAFETFSSAHN